MSNLTRAMMMGAAGASGDKIYVDDVFSTFIYDGNSGTQSINNGIDLAGEGGLIWIKTRNDNSYHFLTDTARGVNKHIASNSVDPEGNVTAITAFNSNGFSLANQANVNQNYNYVSWTFRKTPGFFDVVTYSGNSTAGRQVAHSLGSVPGMIIIKILNEDKDWFVYHRSLGATKNLRLNETDAVRTATNVFNNTEPTSTHFTLGSEADVNGTGKNFVAYVFAHDDASFGTDSNESIVKCGSFTTPGSGDFTVDVGFEPQWLMIKRSSAAGGSWGIRDVMRGWDTTGFKRLFAEAGSTEQSTSSSTYFPINSTGFGSNTDWLGANTTYIYMAIRRPNKPPELATEVFAIDTGNSSSTTPCWDSGFPVDFAIMSKPSVNYPRQVGTRLMGTKYLSTNYSNAEANDPDFTWDSNLGWGKSWNNLMYSWMFKRAPGFMDVVTYTGNLTARTISHNLSAIPELVIVKNRTDTGGASWAVWSSYLSEGYALILNDTVQAIDRGTQYWNANSTFTTTTFGLGNQPPTNQNNHNFVGYLFASLTGISKIGTYSGTGSAINVDCGFDAGARFVLIKRTDAEVTGTNSSGWYVWDTARGIISGNDPYFRLNDNITQVTNTDYIDPLSSGFTVTASAPSSLNVNGGTYLFLAIA